MTEDGVVSLMVKNPVDMIYNKSLLIYLSTVNDLCIFVEDVDLTDEV